MIQVLDVATGKFLYQRVIQNAAEPVLLVDENIYLVKYKSIEEDSLSPLSTRARNVRYEEDYDNEKPTRADAMHSEQLLVIEMMEPFRNETVSAIVRAHFEAVDLWKTGSSYEEAVSAYSRDDPIIHELVFVLPFAGRDVKSMTMTKTAKGITGKQLLLTTNAGELVALPRAYLLPSRRPITKGGVRASSSQEE